MSAEERRTAKAALIGAYLGLLGALAGTAVAWFDNMNDDNRETATMCSDKYTEIRKIFVESDRSLEDVRLNYRSVDIICDDWTVKNIKDQI